MPSGRISTGEVIVETRPLGLHAYRSLAALVRTGYRPISALVEVVDNSVSAKASKVAITVETESQQGGKGRPNPFPGRPGVARRVGVCKTRRRKATHLPAAAGATVPAIQPDLRRAAPTGPCMRKLGQVAWHGGASGVRTQACAHDLLARVSPETRASGPLSINDPPPARLGLSSLSRRPGSGEGMVLSTACAVSGWLRFTSAPFSTSPARTSVP
jgi:hypothetical protein